MNTALKAAIFAGGVAGLAAGAGQAQQLGIGTMGQGTAAYSMATAIARVLDDAGITSVVQPASGTTAFLPLVHMGEIDFAIANEIETVAAINGEAPYDRTLDQLRVVSILYPLRVGLFVRDDSDIHSIADLDGQRVTYGYSSQVTIASVVDALLATGGLSRDDIEHVLVPNVVRGADDFAAGQADAAFFAMGAGKVAEVDAAVGGVRFLPIDDTPEALAVMREHVAASYIGTVEPAANLAGVLEPLPTMSYDYVLLAGAHVPDETVAAVTLALAEGKETLVATFAAFRDFEPERMARNILAEYHAGAISVFEQAGHWPPADND